MFKPGDRVLVNDPTWYRHGDAGEVVKVNKKSIKVKMDGADHDHVVGAPIYFSPEPAMDTSCLGALGCGHGHLAGSAGSCWEAPCAPQCPNPAHKKEA